MARVSRPWSFFCGGYQGTSIVIDEDRDFDFSLSSPGNNFLVAVVMHELGHVLGIPHFKYDDLMFPTQESCNKNLDKCLPNSFHFESFLEMYDPYIPAQSTGGGGGGSLGGQNRRMLLR